MAGTALALALGPRLVSALPALVFVLSDFEVERLGLARDDDTSLSTLRDAQGGNDRFSGGLNLGVLDESTSSVRHNLDSLALSETAGGLLELSLGDSLASSGSIRRPVRELSSVARHSPIVITHLDKAMGRVHLHGVHIVRVLALERRLWGSDLLLLRGSGRSGGRGRRGGSGGSWSRGAGRSRRFAPCTTGSR